MINHIAKKLHQLRKATTTLKEIEKTAVITSIGNPLDSMEET